jgi:two-component system OmpR family response regulator
MNKLSRENSSPALEKPIIKIFLVDDDPMYLKVLEHEFSKNKDIDITSFTTGEECLLQLAKKPDVVVLDYFLNSKLKDAKDGLAILIKIKEMAPDTHVIILSAYENVEIALNCIRYNAFNFIVKNETTFLRLKHSIKQIFHLHSELKELVVWDW